MNMMRYTALVKYNKKTVLKRNHSDFKMLQAMLLVLLQDQYCPATGLIIDNLSGHIVNTYRKATCFD